MAGSMVENARLKKRFGQYYLHSLNSGMRLDFNKKT